MPSPFPGMNPYLEHRFVWPGFHDRFVIALADAITAAVVPTYFVNAQQHIYLTEAGDDFDLGEDELLSRSDVNVSEDFASDGGTATATLLAPAPVKVRVPRNDDPIRAAFLEIRDAAGDRVVTLLELLSPPNKYAGRDRNAYVYKRSRALASRASLVEIDLLRGGPHMDWDDVPACDYCVAVSRPFQRPQVDFWPITLRQRLPEIPIPL